MIAAKAEILPDTVQPNMWSDRSPNMACRSYLPEQRNTRPSVGELIVGWKTPKIEYVNGYKIVEVDGPAFKVFEGDHQLGDDFPYPGEAAAHANSLPRLNPPRG
jgi:hypothetical protein